MVRCLDEYFYCKDFLLNEMVERTSICKVGDCGLQTYQTEKMLNRASTVEITTILPILYMQCCCWAFFYFIE